MIKRSAIIGNFFGDEAKARFVHFFAKDYKYIVRFSGSSNAGHTIYDNGKKIVRHLIPCADFSQKHNHAFLASNMVINPEELLKEVLETEEMFPGSAKRIIVDPDVFLITQSHLEEDKQNVIKFGSTGKGVGVAYRDKIYRHGTKLTSLLNDNNEIINKLKSLGVQFKYAMELSAEFESSSILFEGAQSVLLDINHGTYPYVTSGECAIGGICNAGFASYLPTKIYGVMKAYSTRVGSGPFPTEIHGEEAEVLRKLGKEYGATTGRPRRVGWLDLPSLRYVINKGNITDLLISKFDVLNGYNKIKVCTSYKDIDNVVSADQLFKAVPEYTILDGWDDIKSNPLEKSFEFIKLVSEFTKTKVSHISMGTSEEDLFKF